MFYVYLRPYADCSMPIMSEAYGNRLECIKAAQDFIREMKLEGQWDGDIFVPRNHFASCIFIACVRCRETP